MPKKVWPITYFGIDTPIIGRLIDLFSGLSFITFVDLMGGSGVVTAHVNTAFNLGLSPRGVRVVYNDIDPYLANMVSQIQSQPHRINALLREMDWCGEMKNVDRAKWFIESLMDRGDPLERAAATIVYHNLFMKSGRRVHRAHIDRWRFYSTRVLTRAVERASYMLRSVAVECNDFEDCVAKWDGRGTLFYVDPPWEGAYRHNFSPSDWGRLWRTLEKMMGQYVLKVKAGRKIPIERRGVPISFRTVSGFRKRALVAYRLIVKKA